MIKITYCPNHQDKEFWLGKEYLTCPFCGNTMITHELITMEDIASLKFELPELHPGDIITVNLEPIDLDITKATAKNIIELHPGDWINYQDNIYWVCNCDGAAWAVNQKKNKMCPTCHVMRPKIPRGMQ